MAETKIKGSDSSGMSEVNAAGVVESTVCLRQGHDSLTSMRHYQGLAFSDDEVRDIKKQLTAWGISK